MFWYISIMVSTALGINLLSAAYNQDGYTWNDWKFLAQSFWEFTLFLGALHFYRKSKYKNPLLDIGFMLMIGFVSINAIHSLYGIYVWIVSRFNSHQSIRDIMVRSFDHYNLLFCFISVLFTGIISIIYIINLPKIHDYIFRDK